MDATAAALAQVQATIRAAWIAGLCSVLAAAIGAAVLLIDTNPDAFTAVGTTMSAGESAAAARSPLPCHALVADTLALTRSHPKVAAAYGERGEAALPALADLDDVERCGGHKPERLLEAHYGGR
jgi:hypothetical protein